MATSTLGTTLTTSLTSLVNSPVMAPADLATIVNGIKDDINVAHPVWPGAYSTHDLLYIPNRGVLRVLPGDFVGVDANGWPLLVSAYSIATGGWTHT
jgi:hypothetical protein